MKKYAAAIFVLLAAASSIGWFALKGSTPGIAESSGRIRIAASIPLLRTLGARLGGKETSVASVIDGAACSHEYEPTAAT